MAEHYTVDVDVAGSIPVYRPSSTRTMYSGGKTPHLCSDGVFFLVGLQRPFVL